jgi:hypothetical protein
MAVRPPSCSPRGQTPRQAAQRLTGSLPSWRSVFAVDLAHLMDFRGMFNETEIAEVLSQVRQSFGNNGRLVAPEAVAKIREITNDRVNFYTVDENLKKHPFRP